MTVGGGAIETKTDPVVELELGLPPDRPPRHIVEKNRDGTPRDTALCGFLWDRLNVDHNGSICQECVEIQKRTPKW